MKYGLDSAYPAADPERMATLGWQFVCGYLGPEGGTPHVWTLAEWRAQYNAGLQLLPIWVAPYHALGEQSGVDAGNAALARLQELGLSGVVVLDVENGESTPEYVRGFVAACHAGSCSVCIYGAANTLLNAPDVDSWWLADWIQSGVGLRRPPLDWSMWQYSTGPQFDYNVCVNDFLFAALN